jgi:hypothetical protein
MSDLSLSRLSRDTELKIFSLKASDVVEGLLAAFDEKRVFKEGTLGEGGVEKVGVMQTAGSNGSSRKDKDKALLRKPATILPPSAPPSDLIHYFRWGTKEVYSLNCDTSFSSLTPSPSMHNI